MSFEIKIDKNADKFLSKLAKSQPKEHLKLDIFIYQKLASCNNPCVLPNAKHLEGFKDNRYRWRLGDYRVIGIVSNGEYKIIQIIKISKRDENTYKGL